MENHKLVTIAIPFYNSEKYLSDAISSVINQTYTNWELLLMDDNGTDSSKMIAEEFASKDKRIKVMSDGENHGLPSRLNESVSLAKGEFYVRMDDDDIMAVDRLETQIKYLMHHPDVDVVGSSAMIIDDKNKVIRSSDMSGITTGFIHPTVCGKTEWFRRNKYNEKCRRCQDRELWLRTANNSTFYNIERPLLFYREFGIPSLKKNLKAHQAQRFIFRGYRLYGKSFIWYVKSTMGTYVKDVAYLFFAAFGKMDYLVGKRKRKQLDKKFWLTTVDINKAVNIRNK